MGDILLSIVSIYLFIVIGFFLKRQFRDEVNSKTLTILSVYALQPMLTFWGLTLRPIDSSLAIAPTLFFLTATISVIFTYSLSKFFYRDDNKKGAILTSIALIGNTGNLGIPLGIAIFGEDSVPYTSIINIANILFIYTIGVYTLAKSEYSVKEAVKSIGSIPIIYVAIFALFWNLQGFELADGLKEALHMGAYASIVVQLIIFGAYLSEVRVKEFEIKLHLLVNSVKFLLLPLIGFTAIYIFSYSGLGASVLLMELMMPLAVNSVNMATLYNTLPKNVTALILSSSLLFIALFLLFGAEFLKL